MPCRTITIPGPDEPDSPTNGGGGSDTPANGGSDEPTNGGSDTPSGGDKSFVRENALPIALGLGAVAYAVSRQ